MSAAPVAIAVFEFLDSTHQDIQRSLQQLHALVDAIENEGLNQANRGQARRVLDYFNSEARQHHLDEEKHIFPALLASQNDEIVQATEHLIQDHGWLEENWIQIAPSLEAATGVPTVVMDANDFDQNQLGKGTHFPLTDEQIQDAMADNPSGQGDELTPFILIRPQQG